MPADSLRSSPLEAAQRSLGAEFVSGLGWRWAKTFGDPGSEYAAVREGVGIWDASPHQKWVFRGRDALQALDRIFTRRLTNMEIGQVCYGPFCDANGMMMGDATVFRFSDDHFLVVTAPGTGSDFDHFKELGDDLDLMIEDRTTQFPQLGINGPKSRDLLSKLSSRDPGELKYFRFWPEPVTIEGIPCMLSRTGYSGELGFEVFPDPDDVERIWEAIVDAGAVPYGLDAVETIRVESGLIAYGADFVPHETSPFDVNLDRFIDLRKKHYCGSTALRRMASSPARALATLQLGSAMPEAGAAVTKDGAYVGTVTSPARSPSLGQAIALAVLQRQSTGVGDSVEVEGNGAAVPAVIGRVPIYDSEKKRPRA